MSGTRRPALAAGILALVLGLAVGPAAAENSLLITGDLARVDAGPGPERAIILAQAAIDPRQRARDEVRFTQMEEELRRLTGRVEELEHQQRLMQRRFDQLVGDLDQRLSGLEGGIVGPDQTADAGQAENPNEPENALESLVNRVQEGEGGPPPSHEDGVLGRIPESAVAGLQRPEPGSIAEPEKRRYNAEEQYQAAVDLLQAGDYQGAQNGFELFLDLHPDHPLASNAAYWLGESHDVRQNFPAAAATFARNYRTYGKDAKKAPDNLLKLGMALTQMGDSDKACLSYDELDAAFPSPPDHVQNALPQARARAACS
jgi:tol-pal system protein YbgF